MVLKKNCLDKPYKGSKQSNANCLRKRGRSCCFDRCSLLFDVNLTEKFPLI